MKKIIAIFIFYIAFSFNTDAQQPAPQLLKEPAGWEFERFTLPPVFAPGFPYRGVEELRFSPGMFKKDSEDYFTYTFAALLDSTTSMPQDNIRKYLLEYFKGLCGSTANDRKLVIDTSKITVTVGKKKNTRAGEIIYNALLNIFGVFADGAPVQLNMEIKVISHPATNNTSLIFIASPQPKTGKAWKELYKIQKNFKMPD